MRHLLSFLAFAFTIATVLFWEPLPSPRENDTPVMATNRIALLKEIDELRVNPRVIAPAWYINEYSPVPSNENREDRKGFLHNNLFKKLMLLYFVIALALSYGYSIIAEDDYKIDGEDWDIAIFVLLFYFIFWSVGAFLCLSIWFITSSIASIFIPGSIVPFQFIVVLFLTAFQVFGVCIILYGLLTVLARAGSFICVNIHAYVDNLARRLNSLLLPAYKSMSHLRFRRAVRACGRALIMGAISWVGGQLGGILWSAILLTASSAYYAYLEPGSIEPPQG